MGGFTLNNLLDKPWSQVSTISPPGTCLYFFVAHRVQHSHCLSIFIECSMYTDDGNSNSNSSATKVSTGGGVSDVDHIVAVEGSGGMVFRGA